ncbi:MAG: hypothetical protein ACI4OT_02200 [Bacilli bacterium]
MENKENKSIKRNKILKITALLGLFLLVFGVSYALFKVTLEGTKKNRITTAKFELNLTDTSKNEETEGYAINIEEAVPMTQEEGLETTPYKFVVSNTGTIAASYKLKLEDITDVTNTLQDQYIRYNLISKDYYDYETYEEGKFSQGVYNTISKTRLKYGASGAIVNESPLLSDVTDRVLDETTLLPGECIEYTLNLWVDYEATIDQAAGKAFEGRIIIDGIQAKIFAEGVSGENVKYTYYNDGTLAITGTGAMEGITTDENGAPIAISNNITPLSDIIYNYLTKKEMMPPKAEIDGYPLGMFSYADIVALKFSGYTAAGENYYEDSKVESCFKGNSSSACDSVKDLGGAFNNDVEKVKLAIKYTKEIPKLNRIIIGDGITELSFYSYFTAEGMISLPNTLETIEGWAIYADYINIPNSVTSVADEAIRTRTMNNLITIDNSKEFVEQNWEYVYDNSEHVKYLR